MNLTETYQKERLDELKNLYKTAFPESEQKPFELMLKKREEGDAEILSIEKSGDFLGLAIVVSRGDLALLDYFAVSPQRRGGGVGGEAFEMLKERYAKKRFFIEIEDTQLAADNSEQRLRRKAFYLRHGMKPLPFKVDLFGVDMELLTSARPLTFEEYHALYQGVFGPGIASRIKRREQA